MPSVDDSSFIPAMNCRNGHIRTHKQLRALLKKLPDSKDGIRRTHRGQHLYIHAADWERYWAKQDELKTRALDPKEAQSVGVVAAHVEAMKAEIKKENQRKLLGEWEPPTAQATAQKSRKNS
jgi:hypothetical protein